MKHKTKSSRKEYKGAAPGLHNPAEHQASLRDRKGALALLGLLTVGLLLHGLDPDSAENQPKRAKVVSEQGPNGSAIQRFVEDGADVHTDEAIVLRPGVRLRDTPIVTPVTNGKDLNGDKVPTVMDSTIVLKPTYFTGPYGDTFILVPKTDENDEPYYVSTDVIGTPNEYNNNLPYAEKLMINPDAYVETTPSTSSIVNGGEPALAAKLTTLHYE